MIEVFWENSIDKAKGWEDVFKILKKVESESSSCNIPISVEFKVNNNIFMLTVGSEYSTVVFSEENKRFFYIDNNSFSEEETYVYLYHESYSEIGFNRVIDYKVAELGLKTFIQSGKIPVNLPWETN